MHFCYLDFKIAFVHVISSNYYYYYYLISTFFFLDKFAFFSGSCKGSYSIPTLFMNHSFMNTSYVFSFLKGCSMFSLEVKITTLMVSTNSHCENWAKNWLKNQMMIWEPPNTSHDMSILLHLKNLRPFPCVMFFNRWSFSLG
jgi:hypothetical protein